MRALIILLALRVVAFAAPATEEGRAIVFVVDRGLSQAKIEVVRQAVKEAPYADADRIGVVAFADKAMVVLPLTGGKSRAVHSTTDPTNLAAGLEAAHAMLKKSKQARLVIVFTDREATDGVEAAIARLRADEITVSAIGVEVTGDRALETIATAGKGRRYQIDVEDAVKKELSLRSPGEEVRAYVLVIDRSLSPPKLEAAKERARQQVQALSPNDFVGVIAFEAQSSGFLVRMQRAANRMRISHDISRITTSTPGDRVRALTLARAGMDGWNANEKHVVLYTNRTADLDGVGKDMARRNITFHLELPAEPKLRMR